MIAFPKLGSFGRLGNQLFQIAACVGVANAHGDEIALPNWAYGRHFPLSARPYDLRVPGPTYSESTFSYRQIPYPIRNHGECLRLSGYFQSERYFEHCQDVVHWLLAPHDTERGVDDRAVSVHVRRGDYLRLAEYHPPCDRGYYERALQGVRGRASVDEVRIFSDDTSWCRSSLGDLGTIVDQSNDVDALRAMIRCRHHVIANSSFSWWAAWHAEQPDSVIVSPARWFGPRGPQDAQDLIPTRWARA